MRRPVSTPSDDRFHGALPERDDVATLPDLGSRLTMPLPARTRLLHELKNDLEGLTARLVARGLPLDEARRRASDALIPDEAALSELERLSAPLYGRVTAGVEPSTLRLVERGALAAGTAVLLAVAAWVLLRADLLSDASSFLWPLLGVGGLLTAAVLAKVFELWIKGAHDRPRRGLGAIAALSASAFLLGCAGVLVDLVRLSARLEADPADAAAQVTAWLVRDSALLATAMILGLAGALAWHLLSSWIVHVEHAHREAMALDPYPHIHDHLHTKESRV